ncbi:MAG TPA: pyruvate, phosphate dikinase, partial [Gammaproteobacteria bacterium]|nr:pyruvate, phosphate dikinase [Gammaproteobacteria bacterium]MCH78666.1 pyruvate, phosphate dikinase [Gammaproteobacteria bacterium]
DPPLHEFLPHDEKTQGELASSMGVPLEKIRTRVAMLHELNPMLGHRGCRLAVTYPEILRMQVRAIVEAAIECVAERVKAMPEIMIPLVGTSKELAMMKALVDETAKTVFEEKGTAIDYMVGTMIELPRAALRAGEIAGQAQFFSFGTNDLTQTTFGLSRDDSAGFMGAYHDQGVFETDPFVSLDIDSVGELVRIAAERGRATRADLKLGICGEHGGDPASVGYCHEVGLDYVSCSPYRVPIARLAAAQAALGDRRERDR